MNDGRIFADTHDLSMNLMELFLEYTFLKPIAITKLF